MKNCQYDPVTIMFFYSIDKNIDNKWVPSDFEEWKFAWS
jgi:hypothetical protein